MRITGYEETLDLFSLSMVSIINNWSMKNMDEHSSDVLPVIEESGRGCRSKRKQIDPTCCPVCSVTLRESELDAHLVTELEKLSKLSVKHRRNSKWSPPSAGAVAPSHTSLSKGWETYMKVKTNRQVRLKVKSKKRKNDETTCPVCNQTTTEDITLHVEMCLQRGDKSNDTGSEDENIDVEGFEEYEWAGQTRIRASSLLEGGYVNTGIATSVTKPTSDEEDADVVVDGDDTQVYGTAQYCDEDLRKVYTENVDRKTPDEIKDDTKLQFESNEEENLWPQTTPNPIMEALKSKIRELEARDQNKELYKCLICMGVYKTPVVSVCCWHVHCEQCWLKTLASKKLCPQCNMITTILDLRKIYI